MSQTEVSMQDAISRFGAVEVRFSSYYKYSFSFVGEVDGKRLSLSVGGSHDDIYRFSVDCNPVTAEDLIREFYYRPTVSENDESISLWEL